MDTLELQSKSSLPPILNHSASSEASSITLTGNIGKISLLLEDLSIEDETILSKCTNESFSDVREQLNTLRFAKTDRQADVGNSVLSNDTDDMLLADNNFELSSELEGIISPENTDFSILMKSTNSTIARKDIFKHLYKLNVQPSIDVHSNLTLSSPDKKNNSNKFFMNVPLKLNNKSSKKSYISLRKSSKCDPMIQNDYTSIEHTLRVESEKIESRKNLLSLSSLDNEKLNYRTNFCVNENSSCPDCINNRTISNLENGKKNIFKNKLKHCEVKLFDYLVEQETYDGKHIEKNELINKVFNNLVPSSKNEKESDNDFCTEQNKLTTYNCNINNISDKGFVRKNISDNKENIKEFINYFRKCNSLGYELNKANLYQNANKSLYELNVKISNEEKVILQDGNNAFDRIVNEKNKSKSVFSAETTEKNEKNRNIYSKFAKSSSILKFDVESIIQKIKTTKTISDIDNESTKDIKSCFDESDDSSDLGNNAIEHVSDRISSRLRIMHKLKPQYTKCKSLPRRLTEKDIKKVVNKIASTPLSSKNDVAIKKKSKENKSETKRIKRNQIRPHVKIAKMRKFLRHKLPSSSKAYNLLECEDIIEKVDSAVRNVQSKKANTNYVITTLQKLLHEKNICKNFIEFYTFISNFTPLSFQRKVMPLGGAFGYNGPKVTKKLSDPLR